MSAIIGFGIFPIFFDKNAPFERTCSFLLSYLNASELIMAMKSEKRNCPYEKFEMKKERNNSWSRLQRVATESMLWKFPNKILWIHDVDSTSWLRCLELFQTLELCKIFIIIHTRTQRYVCTVRMTAKGLCLFLFVVVVVFFFVVSFFCVLYHLRLRDRST